MSNNAVTTNSADERINEMSGFGEHRHHGTYDDVAAELAAAARRLAAPLALAARQRAVNAQREAARDREMIRTAERELHQPRAQSKRTARDLGSER